MNFLCHRLERGSPNIYYSVRCTFSPALCVRIVWAKMKCHVLICVGGYKQCCARLYGMKWVTALIPIRKLHEFDNDHIRCVSPPQENPPSTRQKDYVGINALKTFSPCTVWALCWCYWEGPQKVLYKDCWLEMWSHPSYNLHIGNAPIWFNSRSEFLSWN